MAFEKQNENDKSEQAYNNATSIKGNDPLVWQGQIALFEKQGDKKINEYYNAALQLAQIYIEVDDRDRCQAIVDNFVDFTRKCGSPAQYRHSLSILLPSSPIYDYLEGRIMHPAYTYTKIAEILEHDEQEQINKAIGQRRTRLGARIDRVTAEVKQEVFQNSQLEELYRCIIDWTNDDAVRRQYEERLLQRAYDTLASLPSHAKAEKREQVLSQARGLVILKHPFILAWNIVLEWSDVERIAELDVGLLREFITFFPDEGLSKVLRGFLDSEISPFPKPTATEPKEPDLQKAEEPEIPAPLSSEDQLLLMTEGVEDSSFSVLSKRLMGEYLLFLQENESVVDIAQKGLGNLSLQADTSGLAFKNIKDALNIILATALVHHRAPRHHPEARELFFSILKLKPTNSAALIGVGLILEEEEEYADAVTFFDRALARTSDVKIKAEAAWCKALNGQYEIGMRELEYCLGELKAQENRNKLLKAQILHHIGVCMWTLNPSKAARRDRNGAYARFLASIQADVNFAPSYTSLGIFYSDYAKDKKRARKCFQKAFELSSSEVEAAERLARAFAKSREWDFVEVVAQRLIESGKVRPAPGSKRKGFSWPYAALGVVQLHNQEYIKSIVSFQSALRISPEDYHSWVGLGEGYHNSGRYIAATRAFEQAQKLEKDPRFAVTDESWFSEYMLANVQRELGEFEVAVDGYQSVLSNRPKEYGVSIAFLQTLVEGAWRHLELGLYGRAAHRVGEAIDAAQDIASYSNDSFNLWKGIGDACAIYSRTDQSTPGVPMEKLQELLQHGIDLDKYNVLADIDGTGAQILHNGWAESAKSACSQAAILAQKRALAHSANEQHARAVAWYNLGWTEYRAHLDAPERPKESQKKKYAGFLKACVQCFKRAIELEAGNADFWSALGIATTEVNPQVAQHSFIRSLYLNEKSARVWTNLGTLYLLQDDLQLANEAFTRAQSTDPDYANAWLAQGLLAQSLGEDKEARNLFTHAFEIADSSSVLVRRQYALSTFDHLLNPQTRSRNLTDLLQPLLAVRQLRYQTVDDAAFRQLLALFAERAGDQTTATHELTELCQKLEEDFESSESPTVLLRFAQAQSDLSRARLAERDYGAATESSQTALDLTADEGIEQTARAKIRLSAHLTAGLAMYYQGSMNQAIGMFRSALEEAQSDPDIVCLLVQVLWAKGGHQERNVAREQLFDCIGNHPTHFGAVTLLGVVAVLDEDEDTMEAVAADVKGFQTRDDLGFHQKHKLAQLLTAIATSNVGEADAECAKMSQAQERVMLAPSQPHGWIELASLVEEPYPAEMGLLTAEGSVPPGGSLDAEHLCEAYSGTNRLSDAQRSVMVAPWAAAGWRALS